MVELAEVIAVLGGPEVRHGRVPAWWRGGDGLNISVDGEQWFDHVANEGGGPLQLAQTVLGETEGLVWFKERYGARRVPCHRARRVPVVPDELLRRVVASLADARKQVAGEDENELAVWSQVDRIARAGGPEWRKFRERVETADPDQYRHWIRCAVEFEADTKRTTALIVAMLSEAC